MAKGTRVYGGSLAYGNGANPEVFTTIANVSSLNPLSITRESVDVTTLDSPAAYREFCGTLADAGDISFDLVFDPAEVSHAEATGLLSQIDDQENRNYRLTFNNVGGDVWTFSGFVTAMSVTGEVGGVYTASVTIKISGQPAFA